MEQGKPERDKKWVGVGWGVGWGVEGELGGGVGGGSGRSQLPEPFDPNPQLYDPELFVCLIR